ncbi:MAG: TrbI/VirB10 family protein, partial [Alphaproteobacteria bacterium]|nr:TrbI/VirB10 family protein [Alphaproteobacteria bacterium]
AASAAAQTAQAADVDPSGVSIGGGGGDALRLDPARDPNAQGRKLDFLDSKTDTGIYNPHALQKPVSPYELLAGTVISASLITGLDSDLPGLVVAQVTENVFDTVTGRTLLVPQGARLIGTYDSVVAFGQSRALVVWRRIIMPDGSSIEIDNLPATDAQGYAGLEDQIDYHTWTLLKGIALSTLLGVGTQASFGSNNSNLVEAIRQSTQESTNQAGQKIVEKDLDIQPTIKVRPGWPLRVVVSKDIVFRQPYEG